jgi:adenylate kinase family enzyme
MPDYSLGKIYMVYPKVDNADEGDVYYGSTTVTLSRRMSEHRNSKRCKILFDKYGVENCFIELVEEYPCETKEQLNRKEGEYIRANKCINKNIAGRTQKEWLRDNSDKMKQVYKEYRIDNKDKYKDYYAENRDKILEQQKQYKIDNLDKISERHKQKANCPHCNKEITKYYLPTHIKSGRCHILRSSIHTTAPESN